jgi:hypothetical protein
MTDWSGFRLRVANIWLTENLLRHPVCNCLINFKSSGPGTSWIIEKSSQLKESQAPNGRHRNPNGTAIGATNNRIRCAQPANES